MLRFATLLFICYCLISCKTTKRPKVITKKSESHKSIDSPRESTVTIKADYDLATNIVNHAKEYNGVKYKYGGNTEKGMDCSGLICTAFKSENIELPRTSLAMSKQGQSITLDEVQKGDLLFFQTNKNRKEINHVGLVVEAVPGMVEFIHSTSSKGVIISNLNQSYWRLAFFEARRVL